MESLGNAAPFKYAEELMATAKAIAAPGRGILAADESTGTIGKRVSPICQGFVFIDEFRLDF